MKAAWCVEPGSGVRDYYRLYRRAWIFWLLEMDGTKEECLAHVTTKSRPTIYLDDTGKEITE